VNETTITDESPLRGGESTEESELAEYLDKLISATRVQRAPGRSTEFRGRAWGADEPASAEFAPTESTPAEPAVADPAAAIVGGGEEHEEAALTEQREPAEPAPEAETHDPQPSPSGNRPRGAARASMREGLLALFRDTERPSPLSLSTLLPSAPVRSVPEPRAAEPAAQPQLPPTGPSPFLRRFLEQAARTPELAPSGLATLDARLAGGFGPGLHLVSGRPGTGKTAFLESVAWEAVSSERPVLYYALKEGSLGAWERLISTLGNILGGPAIRLSALRAGALGPDDLETLPRLDLALQASVLPYVSLVETIPASADTLGAFIEDVRSRAGEARERRGMILLLLVDDLERLLLLTRARPLAHLLARLDDALVAEGIPGLVATTPPERSGHGLERPPVRTTLALASAAGPMDDDFGRVDLELEINARTGWTGTLPLLLDRRCGLFAIPPTDAEPAD
jgi:hypothetical protein